MVTMLRITSECSVTANILVLGTSDSGFESQHSDTQKKRPFRSFFLCVGVRKQTALFPSGIRMPQLYTSFRSNTEKGECSEAGSRKFFVRKIIRDRIPNPTFCCFLEKQYTIHMNILEKTICKPGRAIILLAIVTIVGAFILGFFVSHRAVVKQGIAEIIQFCGGDPVQIKKVLDQKVIEYNKNEQN